MNSCIPTAWEKSSRCVWMCLCVCVCVFMCVCVCMFLCLHVLRHLDPFLSYHHPCQYHSNFDLCMLFPLLFFAFLNRIAWTWHLIKRAMRGLRPVYCWRQCTRTASYLLPRYPSIPYILPSTQASINQSIYLSIHPSIRIPIHPSMHPSIHASIHYAFINPFNDLSVSPSFSSPPFYR